MDVINEAQNDPNVKIIFLHGGSYFSAGNDLVAMVNRMNGLKNSQMANQISHSLKTIMVDWLMSLAKSLKPIVMLVRGGGIGIGFTMVAHSTFAYCSPEAKFMTPFMKSS